MASTSFVILVLTGFLFLTAAADDCESYFTSSGVFKSSQDCSYFKFCCGSCDNRYCCSDFASKLNEDKCNFSDVNSITIASVIAIAVIFVVLVITCCVCPCCCLYKLCRKPRPVMATHTTTVISGQYPQQQPLNPGAQYAPYQSVPAQPGYGAQAGYAAQPAVPYPYQGQPYAPGPPPPYNESVGPGYPAPYSQAAYDGGKPTYPLQPPPQPGYAQPVPPADYSGTQPPYNPAYVEPPKTGY